MSWFGEKFGDSLTNLKGQITKITKEVLSDEETVNDAGNEVDNSIVKELEALCESKDLEISSLRDEFKKLHNQYKSELEFLKHKNASQKNSCEIGDTKMQQFFQLENELIKLREEKTHLNSCLDELQLEHQTNLEQVISVRDKYKTELENIKKEYNVVRNKLHMLLQNQDSKIDNEKEIENKDSELSILQSKIESLQLEVDSTRKDKEKSLGDMQLLLKEKQKTEEDNKSIRLENEKLKCQLTLRLNENTEIQDRMQNLLKEKEELKKKCQSQESIESKLLGVMNYQVDIEKKLKNVLQTFNIKAEEGMNENTFDNIVSLIEKEWRTHQENIKEANIKINQVTHSLEEEIKKLKEENGTLNNERKITVNKLVESEKKYQGDIVTLKNTILEMKTQQQDCIKQSQTDDVKRLEQEVAHLKCLIQTKSNELIDCSKLKSNLEHELSALKSVSGKKEQDLSAIGKEKEKLETELKIHKNRETELEEKLRIMESENLALNQMNIELNSKVNELEDHVAKLNTGNDLSKTLEAELNQVTLSKIEMENSCAELQKKNLHLQNELEHLNAQLIFKEKNFAELMKANSVLQDKINELQAQSSELQNGGEEIKKWKDTCVDLEMQRQDLVTRREELEKECLRLKNDLKHLGMKDVEILQLKQANANLIESCNQLHQELETKIQAEGVELSKESEMEIKLQKQLNLELQEENSELKSRIQKFQDQMKMQMVYSQNQQTPKDDLLQHKRSRSAIDFETTPVVEVQKIGIEANEEVKLLKQTIQQEQTKYKLLQNQCQEISEKETNARKEFERLKQHLIEMEDHYTEEAVENKKIIDDLKSKLIAAEEQLKNSSTLYTSVKVRDNQHLESLQSQVRLISAQRDDFQAKLSVAEDEVQKHKAALMSLQIVLEQFQQEKEHEIEAVAMKYQKQIQLTNGRFLELEMEIDALKKQLSEAKNGLNAASRLGELLEKKSQQVTELEGNLSLMSSKMAELENNLASANESNSGKIDKSLIKNLVIGYVLSPKADRKSQVLRIMASVLDFDEGERNKVGVDSTSSGLLPNTLNIKNGGPSGNQSFSEAFIKFLENESRPQPQLKFHPEQFEAGKARPSSTIPKPSGLFSELILPTFNMNQENQSSVILKNVLKDS